MSINLVLFIWVYIILLPAISNFHILFEFQLRHWYIKLKNISDFCFMWLMNIKSIWIQISFLKLNPITRHRYILLAYELNLLVFPHLVNRSWCLVRVSSPIKLYIQSVVFFECVCKFIVGWEWRRALDHYP